MHIGRLFPSAPSLTPRCVIPYRTLSPPQSLLRPSSSSASPTSLSSQQRLCSSYRTKHLQPSKSSVTQTVHHYTQSARSNNTENSIKSKQKPTASNMASTNEGDTYDVVFDKNSQWRRNLSEVQPELFARLGKGQSPQILWVGCADSRCPETTILGLQPGDIFCHRNIANILTPTDLNSLSVIQYAVQYLLVKHIIVCGHTSCGGVNAALDNKKLGLIDTWLMPLRALRKQHAQALEALEPTERALKLVDLNVRSSVDTLMQNPIVLDAIAERNLQVHGLIYNVGTGELQEIDIGEDEAAGNERKKAFRTT